MGAVSVDCITKSKKSRGSMIYPVELCGRKVSGPSAISCSFSGSSGGEPNQLLMEARGGRTQTILAITQLKERMLWRAALTPAGMGMSPGVDLSLSKGISCGRLINFLVGLLFPGSALTAISKKSEKAAP